MILVQSMAIHRHEEAKIGEGEEGRRFNLWTLESTPRVLMGLVQRAARVAHDTFGRVIGVSILQIH